MGDFASAFTQGMPEVLELFSSAPVAPLRPAISEPFADALEAYQRALGVPKTVRDAEAFVVTGQQPGLLGGPLYTILKAVSAIQLAERLTLDMGRRTLPVFWIGADDHDFDEMRTASVLTRQHELLHLRYSPQADVTGLPMFQVPVEPSLHGMVDEVAAAVTGSEQASEIAAFLHDSLAAAGNFSEWFARIMARLFQDSPLVIFTTELPEARALAAPVFACELRTPLASTTALNAGGARIRELGYTPQVEKAQEEAGFFLFEAGRRQKVVYREERFHLPGSGARYSADELLGRLGEHPEHFSGNVALRCIIQQELFHPVAYVAGPGEIAYWGQFKPVFDAFGYEMPRVHPRCHAALGSIKLNKIRQKLGLELADLLRGRDAVLEIALAQNLDSPAARLIRERAVLLLASADELAAGLLQQSKTKNLGEMVQTFRKQLADGLLRLENAALREDTARVQVIQQQVERLCNTLAPTRKPQERVLSIFSWLFEHGWDLVPRLLRELEHTQTTLQEIEL